MDSNCEKIIDAIVISWLEVNNQKPTFQKRIYKDFEKADEYIERMFVTKRERISHVQMKVCYKLIGREEIQ